MAAAVALAELLRDTSVDSLLRSFAKEEDPKPQARVLDVLSKWRGYLDALLDSDIPPTIDDLFCFSAVGLLAAEPVEVRSILRASDVRESIDREWIHTSSLSWSERVRAAISYALLLLVRQQNREDINTAAHVIRQLAADQKVAEKDWLTRQSNQSKEAATLLGYYHLARALERIAEFLLAGSVLREGQPVTDFGPELRQLLVRAEEFLDLGADPETMLWLELVAIMLWKLRTDSVWVAGRGISERIDRLLDELVKGERERQVFSLLPSQQEAIRSSLLDPARVAVILQMPTSTGKTLLAEFAILQAFEAYKGDTRVAYVVPTRALATQVHRTLIEDLRPLGIDVATASSAFEEDPFETQLLLQATGIVVLTPEKLDLILRAHPKWLESLRLVVVDEAHLLKDKERGVRLELLLANLRREQPHVRLLLLTPFIENAREIASWLGGARGLSITVQWRPAKLLLGFCEVVGRRKHRAVEIEWRDPFTSGRDPLPVRLSIPSFSARSTRDRVVLLAERLKDAGTILGLCSASRKDAELAAKAIADTREILPVEQRSPALRLAIAITRAEYGEDSALAYCLERGTAFHHSALSSILRFLIEDQVRSRSIDFIMATTTLAQGINFPVAVVLVHSVHKPYGGGPLDPAEFWNIAGRAGRVGLVDRGLVVFAGSNHRDHFERYSSALTSSIQSALLLALGTLPSGVSLKELYRRHEELRPFIQYLGHAAATMSPAAAAANLEELLQASLANAQVSNDQQARTLRGIARTYLSSITRQPQGYLKVADTTGLGSFSFDELYAKIRNDQLLRGGPREILLRGQEGMTHLVEALKWLPELELAVGLGEGHMSSEAVARVVQGWLEGKPIIDLSNEFPGEDLTERVRRAATYVFSKVSQTLSWGAHAYLRGWSLLAGDETTVAPADEMLPAYIQHGVRTPEAAVASLFGVPRQFAEPFGALYRERYGQLTPDRTPEFLTFVEDADIGLWQEATQRSSLSDSIDPSDVRVVWRQMQGLESH
ncbi:MAG: DEAD/DEAH box helicase [Gemmatimonadales bacterium]